MSVAVAPHTSAASPWVCAQCRSTPKVEDLHDLTLDIAARVDELITLFPTVTHRQFYCTAHPGNNQPEECPVCCMAAVRNRRQVRSRP